MKQRFWCWRKQGSETFFSGREPSREYEAALKRDGYEIYSGVADLPDWSFAAHREVKATMHRSLTPGSMPAVGGEAK
jgi:hypothetical protein